MTRDIYEDAVTIDSINILPYLSSYNIIPTIDSDGITSGNLRLSLSVYDVLTPMVSQEVIISRGLVSSSEDTIFIGHINKFSVEDNLLVVHVSGRFSKYKKMLITYSFDKDIDTEAGVLSAIWGTIINGGGITASYETSGTDTIISKFICNDDYRYERATTITRILGWQQYDDYNNDYIRLEPKGFTSYGTKLVVGTNIINIPAWEEELEPIVNSIKIKGVYDEDTDVIETTGDGTTDEFNLNKEPEITEVYVNNVLQVRGVEDSTTSYDYLIDKINKKIIFTTPPGLGLDVSIKYSYRIPRPVQAKDYTSISQYNMERAEVYKFDDILTITDATVRIRQLLKLLAYAPVRTTLNVYPATGIRVGMLVDVEDSINPQYNGTYIVNEIEYKYPEPYDTLKIGSTDFKIKQLFETISARLKVLESEQETNSEELTSLIQLIDIMRLRPRLFKRTSGTLKDAITLYWNHPTQGKWNNFKWATSTSETLTTDLLMPGDNVFREYVYDTMFYDSVNSSGVIWNTTTNEISIAGTTGVLYTNAISIGKDYTNYKMYLNNPSASGLTVEISCDGKSTWETVTLNEKTDFIGTTTDIYLRISNTTGLIKTLSNLTNTAGKKLGAAIEVEFE